jgi:F-type H+-transporting ATPase subunit delta
MKISRNERQQAKELFRLCFANGRWDEGRASKLLERVLAEKPRGYLPVLVEFQRLVRLDRAEHTAVVETATPLPSTDAEQVQKQLTQEYGTDLNTSFTQNPALIGGMRITVGSDVYDGSVKGRIAALERRFSHD